MNKRFITRAVAGTLAATALLLGSLSAPAQAAKSDTGSGASGGYTATGRDTGWF